MRHINLTVLVCLGVAAFAQQVHFDYDRSANFSEYKTYQWVNYQEVQVGDQILDQDIKRAVDAQLPLKVYSGSRVLLLHLMHACLMEHPYQDEDQPGESYLEPRCAPPRRQDLDLKCHAGLAPRAAAGRTLCAKGVPAGRQSRVSRQPPSLATSFQSRSNPSSLYR